MADGYERKWETRRGGRSVADSSRTSYYGAPMVKAPHWDWKIVWYFFLGGISSAAYVIASVAELFGGREAASIKRVGRYLSLAALLPSPPLLIADLGRPERFLNMLRVIKLRSPMSVGTWGLTVFGAFSTLTALIQAADDGLLNWIPPLKRLLGALPCRTINVIGGAFGFFVGGYTGVLLGITAIPLWARSRLLLGPLFLSSAVSSAAAAIGLLLSLFRRPDTGAIRKLERLDTVALSSELALLLALRGNLGPVIGRPLSQGRQRRLFRFGILGVGIAAPLLLQAVALILRRHPRALTIIASLCTLAGGFCLRHVMVYAGIESAADPEAAFEYARKKD